MKTGTKLGSVEQIHAATTAVQELKTRSFVVPLSDAERLNHRLTRLGPVKLRQVGARLEAARQHRELLPPGFDLKEFERDAEETLALGACLKAIDELYDAVNDTFLAVGKRAIVAGTTAYNYLRVSSKTAESLKRTVQRTAGRRPATAAPEPTPKVVPIPTSDGEKPVETSTDMNLTEKAA